MLNQSLISKQVRIIRIIIKYVSMENSIVAKYGIHNFIVFFLKHPFWTITNVKIVFRYYLWPRKSDL